MDVKVTSRTSKSQNPSYVLSFDSPIIDPTVNEFVLGVGRVVCDLDLKIDYVVRTLVFALRFRELGDRDPAEIGSEINQTRDSLGQCELDSIPIIGIASLL